MPHRFLAWGLVHHLRAGLACGVFFCFALALAWALVGAMAMARAGGPQGPSIDCVGQQRRANLLYVAVRQGLRAPM